MSKTSKIGIVGYGSMGQWMAQAFHQVPGVRVVGVAEVAPDNSRAAELHGLPVHKDHRQLLRQGLDGVYIATPNMLHREHVLAAAASKIPVLCEKPIALTVEDAVEMVQAVEEAGIAAVMNFSLRFYEPYERLRTSLEQGELGDLLACWCQRFRGYGLFAAGFRHPAVIHPEQSGGWAIHHSIHAIDWLIYVAGPVTHVAAKTIRSSPQAPSDEGIFALLQFGSGAVGQIADSIVSLRGESVGLVGTRGTATYDSSGTICYTSEFDRLESKEEIPLSEAEGSYGQMVAEHFVKVIRGEEEPRASLEDGLYTLRVTHALLEAARSGEVVLL